MPQNSKLSRYDHLKAIFSRHSSQQSEIKDDATSETTLVPQHKQKATRSVTSLRIITRPICASALAAEIDTCTVILLTHTTKRRLLKAREYNVLGKTNILNPLFLYTTS
ncbi:unnamed protein product [Penicillium egyptiacum]|uniref:Uncharacterized protein n=1 Tax=Penicillium egyptiacum TaxID=1303716 RepID=A0A9W4K645_9EURO|nr:unnamed protein product [Penicillium egyptiacum]